MPVISPVEAFGRAADAFSGLLAALAPDAWRTPVLRDLDVQGLVGHLTGVEDDVQRALAGDPEVACADHVGSTAAGRRASDGAVAGGHPAGMARRRRAHARPPHGKDLDAVVRVHGMRLPLGSLLVVRAFELWTHENDIRGVAGLPASVPDAVDAAADDRSRRPPPAGRGVPGGRATMPFDVHLVLTGPGGGTWDVVLGERPRPRTSRRSRSWSTPSPSAGSSPTGSAAELGASVTGRDSARSTVLTGARPSAAD